MVIHRIAIIPRDYSQRAVLKSRHCHGAKYRRYIGIDTVLETT
jgi:hypothetical protein